MVGLAGLAAAGGVTGCGKFFPPLNQGCTTDCTTAVSYMYAANFSTTAPSIAGFSLTTTTTTTTPVTSTLTLASTANSPYALAFVPLSMAITPGNSYLYVGAQTGGIYIYAINTDRSITLQSTISPAATVTAAKAMQVDSTGKWLLVANLNTSTTASVITIYSIDTTTGGLTSNGTLHLKTLGAVQQMAIAPNNTNVAVTLGTGGLEPLTFNASTGVLTDLYSNNIAPGGTGNTDIGVTFNPGSGYVFETETVASAVRVFSVGTTGVFTEVTGSPFSTDVGPSAVLVDTSGTYVYVTNQGASANDVSAFVLGANGTLTEISGSPFAAGTTPVGIVEDAKATYVGVVSQGGDPDLQIYSFDATTGGKLDAAGNTATGTDPTSASAIVATH